MTILVIDRSTTQGYEGQIAFGTRKSVGCFKAGTRLVLSLRKARLYDTANSKDGPYLRITPVTTTQNSVIERVIQVADGALVGASSAPLNNVATNPEPDIWPYDIDPCQPVLLPFDANVELIAISPGNWQYEVHAWKLSPLEILAAAQGRTNAAQFGDMTNTQIALTALGNHQNSRLRHTRWVLAAQVRTFTIEAPAPATATLGQVPRGVQEFEFNGVLAGLQLSPASDGTGLSSYFSAAGGFAAPLNGLSNRRSFVAGSIEATGGAAITQLTFWCSLP